MPPYAEIGSEASACCVGLLDRRRDGDAARVRVLDDHARRQRELAREQACGGEVVEVVVRELLAVQLLDAREQVHAGARLRVVRGALVRVLAVREVGHLRERRDEALGEELDLVEPPCDRRLVRGGRRERLAREPAPRLERKLAVLAQLTQDDRRTARADRPARRARSSSRPRAASTGRRRRSSRPPRPRARRASRRPPRTGRGSRRRGRTGSISCSSSVATSSSRSRRARMPAWMRGWSVLTRPPSISGAFVTSSTRVDVEPVLLERGRRSAARDELPAEFLRARARSPRGRPCRRRRSAHAQVSHHPRQQAVLDRLDAGTELSTVSSSSTETRSCAITGPVSTPSST